MASFGRGTHCLANGKIHTRSNVELEYLLIQPMKLIDKKAPQAGFEPATNRLTADRSTTELLRIIRLLS